MKHFLLLVSILLCGCTSTTMHVGQIDEKSILYWVTSDKTTHSKLTIVVKTEGSTNIAEFNNQDGQIRFMKRPSDIGDIDGVCGVITGAESIEQLRDRLHISIWCSNNPNPFNTLNHQYPSIPTPIEVVIKSCSIDNKQMSEWECLNGS